MLASGSRDAMSARREHATLLAKQQQSAELEKELEATHPGDEGSLRRWEEVLRSADVNGGRWRSDLVGADSTGRLRGCKP